MLGEEFEDSFRKGGRGGRSDRESVDSVELRRMLEGFRHRYDKLRRKAAM